MRLIPQDFFLNKMFPKSKILMNLCKKTCKNNALVILFAFLCEIPLQFYRVFKILSLFQNLFWGATRRCSHRLVHKGFKRERCRQLQMYSQVRTDPRPRGRCRHRSFQWVSFINVEYIVKKPDTIIYSGNSENKTYRSVIIFWFIFITVISNSTK